MQCQRIALVSLVVLALGAPAMAVATTGGHGGRETIRFTLRHEATINGRQTIPGKADIAPRVWVDGRELVIAEHATPWGVVFYGGKVIVKVTQPKPPHSGPVRVLAYSVRTHAARITVRYRWDA